LGLLIDRLVPQLRRQARRLIGKALYSWTDEEDLVQETCLALWQGHLDGRFALGSGAAVGRLALVLMDRIAARFARQELQGSRPVGLDLEDLEATAVDLDPAQRLRRSEALGIAARLRTCFDAQSWTYIQLHYVEGWRASEAAAQVGLTVGALRKRIERARAALPADLVKLAYSWLGGARAAEELPESVAKRGGWGGVSSPRGNGFADLRLAEAVPRFGALKALTWCAFERVRCVRALATSGR
jgi:RNA polymerase sigma factor (sigma-70 family)